MGPARLSPLEQPRASCSGGGLTRAWVFLSQLQHCPTYTRWPRLHHLNRLHQLHRHYPVFRLWPLHNALDTPLLPVVLCLHRACCCPGVRLSKDSPGKNQFRYLHLCAPSEGQGRGINDRFSQGGGKRYGTSISQHKHACQQGGWLKHHAESGISWDGGHVTELSRKLAFKGAHS